MNMFSISVGSGTDDDDDEADDDDTPKKKTKKKITKDSSPSASSAKEKKSKSRGTVWHETGKQFSKGINRLIQTTRPDYYVIKTIRWFCCVMVREWKH